MKSHKAAISLITRKRLFSETIRNSFSHVENTVCLFAEDLAALLITSAWYRYKSKILLGTVSEALGKEKHIPRKASRGASRSKTSRAVFRDRPLPELSSVSPGLQCLNRIRMQTAYHRKHSTSISEATGSGDGFWCGFEGFWLVVFLIF